MNIARWFSYTRLLERELIRARRENERNHSQWETDRQRLEDERQRVENVVFQSSGVAPPHRHLMPTPARNTRPSIPRAVGPFGVAARNARLEEQQDAEVSSVVHAPELPELSAETQERVKRAAVNKGLVSPEVAAPEDKTAVA